MHHVSCCPLPLGLTYRSASLPPSPYPQTRTDPPLCARLHTPTSTFTDTQPPTHTQPLPPHTLLSHRAPLPPSPASPAHPLPTAPRPALVRDHGPCIWNNSCAADLCGLPPHHTTGQPRQPTGAIGRRRAVDRLRPSPPLPAHTSQDRQHSVSVSLIPARARHKHDLSIHCIHRQRLS